MFVRCLVIGRSLSIKESQGAKLAAPLKNTSANNCVSLHTVNEAEM